MDDSGVVDPDTGTEPDAGDPDTGVPFPAIHPNPPRVIDNGGPTASAGVVIPVFYANDPLQTSTEAFLKQLSPSTYWTATTKEYGVGDFTLGNSIVLAGPAPSSIDDPGIQTFLATHADGSDMAWPKADGNTIYALFYPSGTTINLQNSLSCQSFGAYHSDTNLADNTEFAYAVMPRCQGGIDTLTGSTSHELIEWATDPFPMTNPAYGNVDTDHLAWGVGGASETGDMCETYSGIFTRILGNFIVQRTWSNDSMKAGHDPCVPAPAGVAYFNAAPSLTDVVKLNFGGGGGLNTKGVKVPVGMSKTIDVTLYSDAPKGPWTVNAHTRNNSMTNLTFAWDNTTGQNGDVLHLTITSIKATTSGASSFIITSTDAQMVSHNWYGYVGF
jgi:hypothetical protein